MPSDSIQVFARSVIGDDAFGALNKAAERAPDLAGVVWPRLVIGWVNLASRWDYDGFVPGHENSLLRFTKSENGLTGSVAIGESQLDFEDACPENLSAILCVALGCTPELAKSENSAALAALGASIDLMVTQRVVALLKAEGPPPRCNACSKFYHAKYKDKCPYCSVDKTEPPGKSAAPQAPDAQIKPEAPTPNAPKRVAKPTTISLTKSMAEHKCSVCQAPQVRKGQFIGCHCLRDLGRFAKSEKNGDRYLVTFDPEHWTKNNVRLLLDIVGANNAE
jgi:hypothetical protein